jgi:Cytochrome P450
MTAIAGSELEIIDVPHFESLLDPYTIYAELAGRGPLVRMRSHRGVEIYGITETEAARAALRDPRLSKASANMRAALEAKGLNGPQSGFPISGTKGSNLLNTDPPDHTRLRRLVNLTFSPRRVEILRQQVEALVGGLLDAMESKDAPDLIGDYAYPIALTMICDILGVPKADRDRFRHLATQAMTPGAPDQLDCHAQLMSYLVDLVAVRRRTTDLSIPVDEQPDVLAGMTAARMEDGEALTDDDLVSMSFMLLIAGHETTVGLIGNALLLLARYPDQRDLLLADPALLRPAIEEVLRFDGPVHATTMRVTAEDLPVGDHVIPAGNFVQVLLSGCNRDPRLFEDPNRFDIRRKPSQNMAFGYGAHMCLGSHLARLEGQVAIQRMLERFPAYRLACRPEEVRWAGTVIRAALSLPADLGKGA